MTELHDSHDWGEREYRDDEGIRYIPYCRHCRVDGFENEPAAFILCSGKRQPKKPCPAKLWSLDDLGHEHTCMGDHSELSYHFCLDCRRWFGVK